MIKLKFNIITQALGSLACSVISVSAVAHGWVEFPAARQSICNQDGGYWSVDGQDIPNAACKLAYDMSGTYPFVQRNEFAALTADYHNMDAVKRQVPNGQLCSAGSKAKAGMSIASSQWQKTEITLDDNAQIELVFNATAPHNPSFWQFYLTKPSYDHTQALTWDDLELVDTAANVMTDSDRKYRIKINLPTDRSGDAILYTRWQRDDAAGEGFYNCSDISFTVDGESGGGGTPDPELPQFNELGYYVPIGYPTPDAGDYISFRGFNQAGAEVLEERVLITDNNRYDWPEQLALQVSDKHKDSWFIGVWHAEMVHYMYDTANLHANQVWAEDAQASYAVSIIDAVEPPIEPEPPIKPEVPAGHWDIKATYVEGNVISHNNKNWRAYWWTKGDEPGTTGEWGVWREVTNTEPLPPEPELPEPPTDAQWSSAAVYNENDLASHNNQTWRAHWWTQGEEPGTTGQWGVWRLAN